MQRSTTPIRQLPSASNLGASTARPIAPPPIREVRPPVASRLDESSLHAEALEELRGMRRDVGVIKRVFLAIILLQIVAVGLLGASGRMNFPVWLVELP